MRKIIFLFVLVFTLFGCYIYAQAGTWSHDLIRTRERPWGLEALVKLERSPTGEKTFILLLFKDMDELTSEGPGRVANIKEKLELNYSPLNDFDIGFGSRDIMKSLIIWIRNNPDATFNQAIAAYDSAFPDAIWKGSAFFLEAQDWIKATTGQEVNWSDFKTYVINNIFAGVDG